MVTVVGIACVAWTIYEVVRLARGKPVLGPTIGASPRDEAAAGESWRGPRASHFAAWDDHGRPIAVEDIGHP